jgi:HEAT repeats
MQTLEIIAASFAERQMLASRQMRALLDRDPQAFARAALSLLCAEQYTPGHHYALALLMTNDLIVDRLCNPQLLPASDAIRIAKRISETLDSFFDVRLTRLLISLNGAPPAIREPSVAVRVLEILDGISDGSRTMTLLTQLLGHSDDRIRSKVALIIGRINRNVNWVEQRMQENDSRVRANAVESLWGTCTAEARGIFEAALSDPDNRVTGNAALGLYRCGDLAGAEGLIQMIGHQSSKFRTTAAWAMGETEDPRFLSELTRRVVGIDPLTRPNVFRAITRIRDRVKRSEALPRVRVYIVADEVVGGRRRLKLSVTDDALRPVSEIRPIEVVITSGPRIIHSFCLQERRQPDHLTAGFAIPRPCDRESALALAIAEMLREFIPYKSRLDAWTVYRYAAEQPAAQIELHLENALLSGGSRQARAVVDSARAAEEVDPPRFSGDPKVLLDAASTAGSKDRIPPNLNFALRQMVSVMALPRGARYLCFLIDRPPAAADWANLGRFARDSKVAFHAIIIGTDVANRTDRALFEICDSMTVVESADELGAVSKRVAANLAANYTIEYADSVEPKQRVRVQIFKQQCYGEAVSGGSPVVNEPLPKPAVKLEA